MLRPLPVDVTTNIPNMPSQPNGYSDEFINEVVNYLKVFEILSFYNFGCRM